MAETKNYQNMLKHEMQRDPKKSSFGFFCTGWDHLEVKSEMSNVCVKLHQLKATEAAHHDLNLNEGYHRLPIVCLTFHRVFYHFGKSHGS